MAYYEDDFRSKSIYRERGRWWFMLGVMELYNRKELALELVICLAMNPRAYFKRNTLPWFLSDSIVRYSIVNYNGDETDIIHSMAIRNVQWKFWDLMNSFESDYLLGNQKDFLSSSRSFDFKYWNRFQMLKYIYFYWNDKLI